MKKDRVRVGLPVAPGVHTIIREKDDGNGTQTTEVGYFAALKNGEAIPDNTEIVLLDEESEGGWRDVKLSHRAGPAQVATRAYRDGYDRIFGKQEVGQA